MSLSSVMMIAITMRTWMKPPIVYAVTIPSSQSAMRMTAIVQSMIPPTGLVQPGYDLEPRPRGDSIGGQDLVHDGVGLDVRGRGAKVSRHRVERPGRARRLQLHPVGRDVDPRRVGEPAERADGREDPSLVDVARTGAPAEE